MVDVILAHHLRAFALVMGVVLLFKILHFARFKRHNWTFFDFFYFPRRTIQLSDDYSRKYIKILQNILSITLIVIVAIYIVIRVTVLYDF
jgi:biopolymer transport protein ExbB/TolQ